jgi:outer membrane protein TolC
VPYLRYNTLGFKDRELERLVDLALAGNHDRRIAVARLREARALWDETAFGRYPTVTTEASYVICGSGFAFRMS